MKGGAQQREYTLHRRHAALGVARTPRMRSEPLEEHSTNLKQGEPTICRRSVFPRDRGVSGVFWASSSSNGVTWNRVNTNTGGECERHCYDSFRPPRPMKVATQRRSPMTVKRLTVYCPSCYSITSPRCYVTPPPRLPAPFSDTVDSWVAHLARLIGLARHCFRSKRLKRFRIIRVYLRVE